MNRKTARRSKMLLVILATAVLAVFAGIVGASDAEYTQYEASQSYK